MLACHAALPVVLNPDLVHLLRINYFLDPPVVLPYTAEAQLLLSPLCSEVDDGLYVMDPDLRDVLLQRLVKEYTLARVRDVARLLWEYGERGAPWQERPGLAEAQQLTALSFIDPQRAESWLARTERGEGPAPMAERWFVAMRRDLAGRAAAVKEAETSTVFLADQIPALAELRDALVSLYPTAAATRRIAKKAGVDVAGLAAERQPAARWQRVLETAWVVNQVPAVLEAAAGDHPETAALASAIQEYWLRMTPALPMWSGRSFGPAPPEWRVLEQHRAQIASTAQAVCLLRIVGEGKTRWSGPGFFVGRSVVLTHWPTVGPILVADNEGKWQLKPELRVFVELAVGHNQWPAEGPTESVESEELMEVEAGRPRFEVTNAAIDGSGVAVLEVGDQATSLVRPLRATTRRPADLVGRKVYLLGYPMLDSRIDPIVLARVMEGELGILRLLLGEIVAVESTPMSAQGLAPERFGGPVEGDQLTHNCFTTGGTGGAPVVDLETGEVLGVHYGGVYRPGPRGLKLGAAIALWSHVDRPLLAGAGVFEDPMLSEPASPRTRAVSNFFNPPERIRETGRRLHGRTFNDLTRELREDEVLIGLYRNDASALVATHLASSARMSEMEDRWGDRHEGYFAVDAGAANEGLDYEIGRFDSPHEFMSRSAPSLRSEEIFLDREAEVGVFLKMLDGKGLQVLAIEGDAGIGKTTLLRHFTRLCDDREVPYCWVRLEGTNVFDAVRAIAVGLNVDLRESNEANDYLLTFELVHQLAEGADGAVLFFDGLDEAPAGVVDWLRSLFLPLLTRSSWAAGSFTVVLAARDLQFAQLADREFKRVTRLRLGPMDQHAIREWLSAAGLGTSRVPELVELLTRQFGHQPGRLAQLLRDHVGLDITAAHRPPR